MQAESQSFHVPHSQSASSTSFLASSGAIGRAANSSAVPVAGPVALALAGMGGLPSVSLHIRRLRPHVFKRAGLANQVVRHAVFHTRHREAVQVEDFAAGAVAAVDLPFHEGFAHAGTSDTKNERTSRTR